MVLHEIKGQESDAVLDSGLVLEGSVDTWRNKVWVLGQPREILECSVVCVARTLRHLGPLTDGGP